MRLERAILVTGQDSGGKPDTRHVASLISDLSMQLSLSRAA